MLTMHAETWGDQIRAYEREKRYVVDAGFVSGQPLRLQPGMFQAQERSNSAADSAMVRACDLKATEQLPKRLLPFGKLT